MEKLTTTPIATDRTNGLEALSWWWWWWWWWWLIHLSF